MKIANFSTENEVFIIAEIGNNHEGKLDLAVRMVEEAKKAGVNAVKFQTFRTEHYVSRRDSERFKRLQGFELRFEQFATLRKLAHSLDLLFLSTPFDLESADFLANEVDAFKIASGDNDFYPLLDRVLGAGKPLLVSTGASDLTQVDATVSFLREHRRGRRTNADLALLHCVTSYPTPLEQANLRAIRTMIERYDDVTVGYSDHTMGIDASLGAVALGARILEKHFTLDKNLSDFRDHKLSADPRELASLVQAVRRTETMLGTGSKEIQPAEAGNVALVRRSICAARDLKGGAIVSREDITWLRPAGGVRPGREDEIVGRRLRVAKAAGEPFRSDEVE